MTELPTRMNRGKCVPGFRIKVLNCLKTAHSSIFKVLKEITFGYGARKGTLIPGT